MMGTKAKQEPHIEPMEGLITKETSGHKRNLKKNI